MAWWFLGLFALPCVCLAQAKTQPELQELLRFERVSPSFPLGVNTVQPFDEVLLLGANKAIVRSVDSGRTWDPILSPLQHKNITTIVVHGNELIAGTASGGLYRSTDRGLYWERFSTEPRLRRVKSLLRTEDGYVASNDSGECFERSDTDSSWTPITLPAPCLSFVVFDEQTWFMCANGALLSDEGKGPKHRIALQPLERVALVGVGDYLTVVGDLAVLVLDDDADSVATWPVPIADWTVSVALHDQLLVGGRSTGLRKLNLTTGATAQVFSGPAEIENISAIIVTGDTLAIGTSRGAGRCYVVSLRSLQWHALNPGWLQGTFDVTDLAYQDGVLFVSTREEGAHMGRLEGAALFPIHDAYEQSVFSQIKPLGNEKLVVGRRTGLWRLRSAFGKLEWFTHTLPRSHEFFATTHDSRVIVGLSAGRVVWSEDDGKSWATSQDTLPSLNELTTIGSAVYASSKKGVYRSDDAGEHWKIVEGPWLTKNIVRITGSPDTFFVATTDATYRYIAGQGDKKLDADFASNMQMGFTNVTLRNGVVFATGISGVYVSADAGDTWEKKTFERANAMIYQFFYKGYYYVFTDVGALWRSRVP